jgi:hypothetical protein
MTLGPVANLTKLFSSLLTLRAIKLVGFSLVSFYSLSQMFANKTGPSEWIFHQVLTRKHQTRLKGLPYTNSPAYFPALLATKKKKFYDIDTWDLGYKVSAAIYRNTYLFKGLNLVVNYRGI